jgi:hypothetical protein
MHRAVNRSPALPGLAFRVGRTERADLSTSLIQSIRICEGAETDPILSSISRSYPPDVTDCAGNSNYCWSRAWGSEASVIF